MKNGRETKNKTTRRKIKVVDGRSDKHMRINQVIHPSVRVVCWKIDKADHIELFVES